MTAFPPAPATGDILLVIPAFRESRRLPAFLEPLLVALRDARVPVRVRVVDDGSPEAEREAVRALCGRLSREHAALMPPLLLPRNTGKGGAIRAGWDASPDDAVRGFCDADGSIPPAEIVRLIRHLLSPDFAADALIASRAMPDAVTHGRTPFRAVLSRLFAVAVRRLVGLDVRDSQCGCKFVRRAAYDRIRDRLVENRYAFDVELLTALVDSGADFEEAGVAWRARAGGSLSPLRDGYAMLGSVVRIARRFRRRRAR